MAETLGGKRIEPPAHHPQEDQLIDYAAGSCGEPEALIMAAHLTLCQRCRDEVRRLEAVGGALLEDIDPAPVSEGFLARTFERIDQPGPAAREETPPAGWSDRDLILLPAPVRAYLDGGLDRIPWRTVMRGRLEEHALPIHDDHAKVRLLRITAGAAMPRHTHTGREMTLVLCGSFDDGQGRFARGDLSVTDDAVDHRPVAATGEDCICLTLTDAPLKLTGPLGRLLNPFVRF